MCSPQPNLTFCQDARAIPWLSQSFSTLVLTRWMKSWWQGMRWVQSMTSHQVSWIIIQIKIEQSLRLPLQPSCTKTVAWCQHQHCTWPISLRMWELGHDCNPQELALCGPCFYACPCLELKWAVQSKGYDVVFDGFEAKAMMTRLESLVFQAMQDWWIFKKNTICFSLVDAVQEPSDPLYNHELAKLIKDAAALKNEAG